jgi:hypothetical protein
MVNARGIARVGMLAVGLGIGAALAASPGIASADSSDWLSSIDSLVSGLAAPAADTSGANMAISVDGVTLLQEGSAHAYSGTTGDIAIADGADSSAYAYGTNNYADVLGSDSSGVAGGYSAAEASGSSDDTAFIDGTGDYAYAGGDAAGTGSYDGAYVEGNNLGTAYAQGADYLADILKVYGSSSADAGAAADLTTGADGGNFLADLWSVVDPSAAADSGNFLTDLAALF